MNGGPAFPTLAVLGDKALSDGGLTVRDYFAAAAMQGYLAAFSGSDVRMPGHSWVAGEAVRYADALLAELSATSGEQNPVAGGAQ